MRAATAATATASPLSQSVIASAMASSGTSRRPSQNFLYTARACSRVSGPTLIGVVLLSVSARVVTSTRQPPRGSRPLLQIAFHWFSPAMLSRISRLGAGLPAASRALSMRSLTIAAAAAGSLGTSSRSAAAMLANCTAKSALSIDRKNRPPL